MFEDLYPVNWQRVDDLIERRAAEALAEIRRMADDAIRAMDRNLGIPVAFTNRSLAQRRRFERRRQLLSGENQ